MRYAIELTARDLEVRVVVDASRWPTKVARPQAKEALQGLARALSVAIEAAPHVGTPRELVDISPVVGLDEAADRALGAPTPPEREVAPRVGSVTWEAMESYIRAVQLPEGTKLLEGPVGEGGRRP